MPQPRSEWNPEANTYLSDLDARQDSSLAPTLAFPQGDVPLPTDASFKYSLFSDSAGASLVAGSDWTDQSWQVPAGVMQDGVDYYWSAQIRGSYDYVGSQATVTTPIFVLAAATAVSDGTDTPPDDATAADSPNTHPDSGVSCSPEKIACANAYTGWSASTYRVVQKQLVTSKYLGPKLSQVACGAGNLPCTASHSVTYTDTTQVSFGVNTSFVSAGLNESAGKTTTTTVTCQAAPHHSVQAYPLGKQYKYKIEATRTFINNGRSATKEVKTSGWLYLVRYYQTQCVDKK